MTSSERLARKTLDLMPPEPSDGPPKDVILVVSLIMMIIKLCMIAWQCWENSGKAASIVQKPDLIQRWYFRRIIRKVLVANGQGDKTNQVMAALLQMAKAVTPEDIEAVFREAQSSPEIWVAARAMGIL